MDIHRLINKFRRNFRDYGLTITLRKAMGQMFGFLYDSKEYRIYMVDLRKCNPERREGGEFLYRLITPDDLDYIRQIESMEEWLEGEVVNKLSKGGICLVAMMNGKMAGFNIASFGEVEMPLVKVKRAFRKGEAWSEQITVSKEYRGKGLGTEIRFRMFDELKKRRFVKFYGGTLSNNKANLQLSRKVGFKEIADIRYSQCFTKKRWSCRRAR